MPRRLSAFWLVAALGLAAGACGDGSDPAPPTTAVVDTTEPPPAPTTPTSAPTVSTAPGRPRETTTIPVEIQGGGARIYGTVVGPQGPVAGATIRVERLVGDEVATLDAPSGSGQYNLSSVRGGHYRVRAWKAPDLLLLEPEVFFLAADEAKQLDLRLARVTDFNVEASIEPSPPPREEPFTVTVLIYAGSVTNDGRLQGTSRPGLTVQLVVAAPLGLSGPDRAVTDTRGNATFRVRCLAAGPAPADAIIGTTRVSLGLPDCR